MWTAQRSLGQTLCRLQCSVPRNRIAAACPPRLASSAPSAAPGPHSRSCSAQAAERRSMAAQASSSGHDADHDEYDFDLFVIGGGTGGVRAARMSATYGGRVGLCELPRNWVATDEEGGLGGTCILRGCVPKKLLHYASSFHEEIEDAHGYGWSLPSAPKLDWAKLMSNQHTELERLSTLYQKGLEGAGAKYFEARGRVTGPHSVEVAGQSFKVKNILIAVGGKPIKVPIEGAEHCIVSDNILHLDKQPKKVAMIGGGYISCEQASIYNNFGAEVHLLVRSNQVLNPAFDAEARDFVAGQYRNAGVKLALETTPTKIEKGGDGKLTVTCEPKDGEAYTIGDLDLVMMATGRAPATKNIGLEEIGVKLDDKGGVIVDDFSRSVSVPSVWAVGDVTNRIPLTPVARMEGLLLAQHIFKNNPDARPQHQLVPSVVFSSPEVAVIGLTEQAAAEKHKNIAVYSSSFTPMKASVSSREVKALCKCIVDSNTDKVVGIHIVCPEASEILQGFAAAMKAGITKTQLDTTVGLHPTSAEEFCTMYEPARVYKDGSQHIQTEI